MDFPTPSHPTPNRRRRTRLTARTARASLAALALAACGSAGGEDAGGGGRDAGYPDQEITIVVPFAAGGPTDTVTRLIGEPMGKSLGQQVIIKNVGGAGGTLGANQVAKAKGDGYTVLMHHIGMSTAPALYPKLSYDPQKDFKPIGLVTNVPMTIIVTPRMSSRFRCCCGVRSSGAAATPVHSSSRERSPADVMVEPGRSPCQSGYCTSLGRGWFWQWYW